jgi:D-alanyl-D-alanine carboxypeptidase/D-alanyl-D-alanine-endopeptidase (penicillin-binding protein 4)
MVGMAATVAAGGKPATLKASAGAMSRWAKARLGMASSDFVDHSGLGGTSRMSAADMVAALNTPLAKQQLKPLLKQITLRHDNGKPNKAHPLKVVAKTGTLNFASCLAGYVTDKTGTELAFAILTADQPRRNKLSKSERERPEGGRSWNRRSKRLQQKLLERWGAIYGV